MNLADAAENEHHARTPRPISGLNVGVEMEKTADEVQAPSEPYQRSDQRLALAAIWSGSESCQMLGTCSLSPRHHCGSISRAPV